MKITSLYRFLFPQEDADIKHDDYLTVHQNLRTLFSIRTKEKYFYHGYRFHYLFEQANQSCDLISALNELNTCLCVLETPEFDPFYSHVISYLYDHHDLNTDFIDLDYFAPNPLFNAFCLIKQYLRFEQSVGLIHLSQQEIMTKMPCKEEAILNTMTFGIFSDSRNSPRGGFEPPTN